MSFNRQGYDDCQYRRELKGTVNIFGYIVDPHRFENKNKCRHELGLVGGSTVSHVNANLVDVDSELRGQTRYLTKCGDNMYRPPANGQPIRNDKTAPISTAPQHLKSCQMIGYQSVPLPPPVEVPRCAFQWPRI